MGKSKRAMNPADALRKKQRKRELQKNKEIRKQARMQSLAKKDLGKVSQDIARLEHLDIKHASTLYDRAQAALAARLQEQEKKYENESRKLVFDPKRGAFVPVKKKGIILKSVDRRECVYVCRSQRMTQSTETLS
ncbi:hypothetical protein BDF20DRAFT_817359 [Mycotypha africana]|uniref:uncharacterized protein n=1 Tax=Mycotypha africana TaxID=64632 RepID=UPI0023016C7E|nr:uncharacterized protein BDF20DRAFT_817359 [Mycotypha africana]KAI8982257.1 hypothetical protein BDF20DRAFT_817359 [Mycotypha africana]